MSIQSLKFIYSSPAHYLPGTDILRFSRFYKDKEQPVDFQPRKAVTNPSPELLENYRQWFNAK